MAMCSRILGPLVLALLAHRGLARPVSFLPGFDFQEEDVATVESLRRDVREPAPLAEAREVQDLLGLGDEPRGKHEAETHMKNAAGKSDEGGYYKTFGSDAEGEKGYLKETYRKGDHGYKTFDTFHKRDGDKYGFEKHAAYGKARSGNEGGHHDDEGSFSSKKSDDHEGEGTIVDSHYVDAEGDDHDGAETSDYSEGGGGGHHYSGHYSKGGPQSGNYEHSESYSGGGGDEGAYDNHSSYSSSHGDKKEYQGGHY